MPCQRLSAVTAERRLAAATIYCAEACIASPGTAKYEGGRLTNESQNKAAGIGRGMMIAAWVVGLGLLTLLFDGQLAKRVNPNQNPEGAVDAGGAREVVLQRNARGHYVASGRINGRRVEFLLDTGATDVAIPEGLAEQMGLSKGPGTMTQTANGVVAVWRSQLDTVELGAIRLRDVTAAIVPSMSANEKILLGMSFLKRLEMLQKGRTLTLRQNSGSG